MGSMEFWVIIGICGFMAVVVWGFVFYLDRAPKMIRRSKAIAKTRSDRGPKRPRYRFWHSKWDIVSYDGALYRLAHPPRWVWRHDPSTPYRRPAVWTYLAKDTPEERAKVARGGYDL